MSYFKRIQLLATDGTTLVNTTTEGTGEAVDAHITNTVLPLPTGASTSANQTNASQKTMLVDSTGAILDLWHTGDTYTAAADHGIMILGRSNETPNKYRPLRVETAGGDGESNTSDRLVTEGYLQMYNGSTWDRVRGDITNGLDVDVTRLPSPITGPGAPGIDSYTQVAINLAAGANQVLVSSAASKQIWVYGFGFTVNVAGTVSFQDEDDTAITGIMNIAATGGFSHPCSGNFSMPVWKLATNKDLEVDVVTSELDGWISYAIVSV